MPRLPLQTRDYYDNSGGVDLKSSPTKVSEDDASETLNMDYDVDGAIFKRFGSQIVNSGNQIAGDSAINFYDFKKSDGTEVQIIAGSKDIYQNLSNPLGYGLNITTSNRPDFEFMSTLDDEYLLYGNGTDTPLKFDGTTWSNWSIATPTSGSTAVINAGSGSLDEGDYTYYVAFARYNSPLDTIEELSDVFLIGTQNISAGQAPANIEITIPVSPDPQVNARVIYRSVAPANPGSTPPDTAGQFFRLLANPTTQSVTVDNNTDVTFTDNVQTNTLLEIEFDNQPIPNVAIFENYYSRLVFKDPDNGSFIGYSKPNRPWDAPATNRFPLDGPITCIKRCYGALLFGTDKSIWVVLGDLATNEPRRISSKVGILNNFCAVGEDTIYVITTNLKYYGIRPTDFRDDEIRIDAPLSRKIDPRLNQIQKNQLANVFMIDYTKANISKILTAAPVGQSENNQIIVYNETQSFAKGKPVWHFWDNLIYNAMGEFTINGQIDLYMGDNNGFIWRLDQQGTDGDGAELNGTATSGTTTTIVDLEDTGTATSGTTTTLTDTAKTFTVNQFVGYYLAITGGTGSGETQLITSNTVDTLTVATPFSVALDNTSVYEIGPFEPNGQVGIPVLIVAGTNDGESRIISANDHKSLTVSVAFGAAIDDTSEYSVGGFTAFHFSNWKNVIGTYDDLKTLWHWLGNVNTAGSYPLDIIFQFDFDTSAANEVRVSLPLNANGSLWNSVNWNQFNWSAVSVFQQRIRQSGRFRSIRIGFQNNLAGQPFQVNGFSIGSQNKSLLFESA